MLGVGMVIPLIYLLIAPEKLEVIPFLNQFSYIQAVGLSTVGLVSVFGLKNWMAYFVLKKQQTFLNQMATKLRRKLFEAYIHTPYQLHVKRNSATLINNITVEVNLVSNQVICQLGCLLNEILTSVFVLCFLLWMNVLFTSIIIGSILITVKLFMRKMQRKADGYSKLRAKSSRELIKTINHGLGGIKETKLYQKEPYFCEQVAEYSDNLSSTQAFANLYTQVPRFLLEYISMSVVLSLIFIFIATGYSGEQIMILISVFGATAVQFLPGMNRLTQALTGISYGKVALDNVYQELKSLEKDVQRNESDKTESAILSFEKEITLSKVSYSYDSEAVLNNITLRLPKAKRIAFVGSSGAGKTTLVDIILGVLLPKSGKLLVDGREVTSENRKIWQKKFGYIPQMIYIYDYSLKENIAFGLKKEAIDEERVWECLRQAQLDVFVKGQCAEGLETIVGENGIRLSGGQRQRLGIARALYHNPDILVMDEATAALDNQTEREITKALDNIRGDKTIISIAHRLSTIKHYDLIFVLEKGSVIAAGNYQELSLKSEPFKQMAKAAETA
jgi:ATP-binding cassette subfamily C protein